MKHDIFNIKYFTISCLTLCSVLFSSLSFATDSISAPQNIRIESTTLQWDSVEGATGYNIYILDQSERSDTNRGFYLATVSGLTEYRVSTLGFYTVVSILDIPNQRVLFSDIWDGQLVYFGGLDSGQELVITRSPGFETRTRRCTNVVAAESCTATCADVLRKIPSGGACRADSGVVLHQRVRSDGYECITQQDTSFVEADVICLNR